MTLLQAQATIVRSPHDMHTYRARLDDGPHAGIAFCLLGWHELGSVVRVEYFPDDQFAAVVR